MKRISWVNYYYILQNIDQNLTCNLLMKSEVRSMWYGFKMPRRPIRGKATERPNQALVIMGICMNHSLISAMVGLSKCLSVKQVKTSGYGSSFNVEVQAMRREVQICAQSIGDQRQGRKTLRVCSSPLHLGLER